LTPVLEKKGRVKKKVPGPSDPGGSANMVESLDLETREEVLGPHLRCDAPDAPYPQVELAPSDAAEDHCSSAYQLHEMTAFSDNGTLSCLLRENFTDGLMCGRFHPCFLLPRIGAPEIIATQAQNCRRPAKS